MEEGKRVVAAQFCKEAEKMVEQKDLLKFMENISIAKAFAENEADLLAEITFLKVEGLFKLNQRQASLESIPEALQFNFEERALKLKQYQGVIYGYLGELKKATAIFEELLIQSEEMPFLVEVYLSLAWIYLSLDHSINKEKLAERAKKYLELATEHLDSLSDKLKSKLYNNFSVYYFYKENYAKSIEMLEKAIQHAAEKDLPKLYNNLAEVYLKADEEVISRSVYQYVDQAELLATKYSNDEELGNSFYIRAMAELSEEQFFTALDTLYLAFEHYKVAEMYPYAFDCLVKINDLMDTYKSSRLTSLKTSLHEKLKGTAYYKKI